MSQEIIRLKGKAYDAVTGTVIHDVVKTPAHKNTASTASAPIKAQVAVEAEQPHRSNANHLKAHAAQPSHTLMRHAVKKPSKSTKRQLRAQGELAHANARAIALKHSAEQIDTARLSKAQQVQKHHRVNHFGAPMGVPITFTGIPVRQLPEDIPVNDPPVAPPPTPTNKPVDLFEHAIENATNFVDITAHRMHFKQKYRRHMLSAASGALALALIASFAAYQNTPGLQLKVAGFRAGVATATPDFTATGFAYNGATADKSRLVIGLKNDSGSYQLSEQKTNWSSEDMITQISSVDASGQTNYNTVQAGGHTVYRFGTTQATWVKDGIWYQVNGAQGLTEDQLSALVQNT
jgi:hypothetical protein